MSHQIWDIERHATKGVRSTVKVWPTGEHKRAGMRYRMLRGEWSNTGHESRDEYLSKIGLMRRLAGIEEVFELPQPDQIAAESEVEANAALTGHRPGESK